MEKLSLLGLNKATQKLFLKEWNCLSSQLQSEWI